MGVSPALAPPSSLEEVDEGSEGGGGLTPARKVEERPREGLAPFLKHADEFARRQIGVEVAVEAGDETQPVERRLDQEVDVVGDQRPSGGDAQDLAAALELPARARAAGKADLQAGLVEQILRV